MIMTLYKNIIKYNVDLSICNYNTIIKKIKSKQSDSFYIGSKEDYFLNQNIYQGFLWNKLFKTNFAKNKTQQSNTYVRR